MCAKTKKKTGASGEDVLKNKVTILGVTFDSLSLDEAVDRAWDFVAARRGVYIVTPNPEIVMVCRSDPEAKRAVEGAALTVPDGIGVVYAARLRHTPVAERVPGIDMTTALLERMGREQKRVFLLGSKPGVAEAAGEKLTARFPGLVICGTYDGYFQDSGPVIKAVNRARPDLMLVCLGFPKQEKWMYEHAGELDVGLMIGAGGSLDVFAGVAERAPERWQRLGLEWLYRLKREPKRFVRMLALPKFLALALLEPKKTRRANEAAAAERLRRRAAEGSGKSGKPGPAAEAEEVRVYIPAKKRAAGDANRPGGGEK